MPYTPGPSGGNQNPDQIIYPVDRIREVAAEILVQADQAMQQHNAIWAKVEEYLRTNDDDGHMANVLRPHEKRMRDSYNWQMQLASTLFSALDLIEATDNQESQNFQNLMHNGHGPVP